MVVSKEEKESISFAPFSYALIYLQWLIWDLRAKRPMNNFSSLCKHEEHMKDTHYVFDPRISYS